MQVNSPKVVDGVMKAYLLLEAKDMSTTVTVETWILSVSAKLGALEMLDYLNTGKVYYLLTLPFVHKFTTYR